MSRLFLEFRGGFDHDALTRSRRQLGLKHLVGSIAKCELGSGGAPDAATRSTHPAGVALHLAGGGGRHHRPERVGRDGPKSA